MVVQANEEVDARLLQVPADRASASEPGGDGAGAAGAEGAQPPGSRTATFRPIVTRLGSGGLAFAPRFRVETIEGEAVFLLSERGHVVLRGDAYLRLAPLLDGRRDVTALVDALDGVVPAAEVYFAVSRMRQQGYIVDAEVTGERAGWWNDLGLDATEAERRLARGDRGGGRVWWGDVSRR